MQSPPPALPMSREGLCIAYRLSQESTYELSKSLKTPHSNRSSQTVVIEGFSKWIARVKKIYKILRVELRSCAVLIEE